jgi:ABC-type transporter Mla subunit MlaD
VDNLAVILIILMSIFVILQVGILAGLFVSVRKLVTNVEHLRTNLEEKAEPMIADFREILDHSKDIARNLRASAENFTSVSGNVKYQIERVSATLEDTTDRARAQISKIDGAVADAVQKFEIVTGALQRSIYAPVREISAIIRGVSSGLHYLFARRRNQVNEVHQDEELFI